MGKGGQRRAEAELGWNRRVIRKGMHELESGFACCDNFAARGRKRAEEHLPHLLADIKTIAEAESQTDPTFKTTRLYIRLSAAAVRKQLIEQKGYRDEALPGVRICPQAKEYPARRTIGPECKTPYELIFVSRRRAQCFH